MFAGLVMEGGEWRWAVLATLAGALLLSWWSYRRSELQGRLRAGGIALRAIGSAIILLCLLEPLWTSQRARPGANWFALVADNSQGMQIHDPGEKESRGGLLRTFLNDPGDNWQDSLSVDFQVRRYVFDTRLQAVRDFQALDFTGNSSALVTSLGAVHERFQGLPLAGVLVFTDGNATDHLEGALNLNGLPPVYPVVSGTDEPIKDLAINRVGVTQTAFEDAPVTITSEVIASGFPGRTVEALLTRIPITRGAAATNEPVATGEIIERQAQEARGDREVLSFRFQTRPAGGSLNFYRVQVRLVPPLIAATSEPGTNEEATPVNNERLVMVDRGEGPYRILYVGGRPNWEYKFLKRALDEDDQLRLVGLIRLARREPKFEFKGRSGESSNPLFRGFGNQSADEIERYDQPVLIWLNPAEGQDTRKSFPTTAEDLFPYHAIIFDDVEAAFFTADQLALVQRFVSERGGGFMMLGGQESFREGGYDHTPVGNMLPVYLREAPLADRTGPRENLRLALDREGWLQPWARVRSTENEEQARLGALPAFQVLNTVSGTKPGASVVATVTEPDGTVHPALVTQRFGNGRTAAMLIGDFWRSGRRSEQQQEDQAKAWRQLGRWLVNDTPAQVTLAARLDPQLPGTMRIAVRVKDREFKPMDGASVSVSVRKVAGETATNQLSSLELTAEPVASEPGLFATTYVQHGSGGYLAEATVRDEQGNEVGRAKSGWVSEPAADEFRSLSPNRALLEQIARQTGGEVLERADLPAFVKRLPTKTAPVMESWSRPIWHNPWVFLLAFLCFIGEWALRRWKGLA